MIPSSINSEKTTSITNELPSLSCTYCGKTFTNLLACSRCYLKQYCGPDCQRSDWPVHKNVCVKKDSNLWVKVAQKEEGWKSPESGLGPLLTIFKAKSNVSFRNLKEYWDFFSLQHKTMALHVYLPQFFASPLQNISEKHCIDLGTGIGDNSFYLLERKWKVMAIDYSSTALDIMKKKANEKNKKWLESEQLTLKEQDVFDCEFPDQIDLIVANDFFSYCNPSKIETLLRKIFRALKDGGILLGNFFPEKGNTDDPGYGTAKKMFAETGAWFVDDKAMVLNMLNETGYECLNIQARKAQSTFDFMAKKLS